MASFSETNEYTEAIAKLGGAEQAAAATELAALIKPVGVAAFVGANGAAAKLNEMLTDKSSPEKRCGACLAVTACINTVGAPFEPFVVPMLPSILVLANDKSPAVCEASVAAVIALMNTVQPHAVKMLLPHLFFGFDHKDWKVKVSALNALGALSIHAQALVGAELPAIVPAITDCLWDTKKDTKGAALEALAEALKVIDNPDILPLVPALISANANPEEVPKCIDKLMAVVFVQTVDAPTLSIITPVLARGIRNRDVTLKRKCAVVIDNMCKLVAKAEDAAPLGPKLMPELERTADECPIEEIRTVATKALATLKTAIETGFPEKLVG